MLLALECFSDGDWLTRLVSEGFSDFWSDQIVEIGLERTMELVSQRLDAMATSSKKDIRSKFVKFLVFCRGEGFEAFPPSEGAVLAYVHALKAGGTIKATSAPTYLAAISSLLRLLGHNKTVFSSMVNGVLKGWGKEMAPEDNIHAFPAAILEVLVDSLDLDTPLPVWRDVLLCITMFLFFSRSCSGAGVLLSDLTVITSENALFFRERHTKKVVTDPAQQRMRLRTLRQLPPELVSCYVEFFEARAAAWVGFSGTSDYCWHLPGENPLLTGAAVRARFDALKSHFSSIMPPGDWTSHSLRKGGATAAVNAGIPMWKVRAWGSWSAASKAVWRYVDLTAPEDAYGTRLFAGLAASSAQLVAEESVPPSGS